MSVTPSRTSVQAEDSGEPALEAEGRIASNMETTPQGSQKSIGSGRKRKGRWKRLKKRWNRKGVVEVDIDHHRYELLNAIREAIQDLINNHSELGPKSHLEADDYTHVLETTISTPSGQKFEFCSYASPVFATLRRAVGLSEEDYLHSLAPSEDFPYLEFISNSKGGQDFYLTNDKAYFLKTEKKYYVDVFLTMLGEYLNHFLNYPHSLLVKFLGLYSVKISSESRLYFYVMQSIFFPEERIEVRYDVKGCLAGRYQQPRPPGSQILTILKDQNFVNETIHLGGQRDWFLEQLQFDVQFLQTLGVQDYSLLIGRHPLHPDEKRQDFGDFVNRVKKSLGGKVRLQSADSASKFRLASQMSQQSQQSQEAIELEVRSQPEPVTNGDLPEVFDSAEQKNPNNDDDDGAKNNPDRVETSNDPPTTQDENKNDGQKSKGSGDGGRMEGKREDSEEDKVKVHSSQNNRKPLLGKAPLSLIDHKILDESEVQNRRLLPDSKNPLHVIDGPEYRYYLGIIDFLTLYECRQRMGRMLKNIKFCCGDHSTVHPTTYGQRFLDFIEEHTAE